VVSHQKRFACLYKAGTGGPELLGNERGFRGQIELFAATAAVVFGRWFQVEITNFQAVIHPRSWEGTYPRIDIDDWLTAVCADQVDCYYC
jgi:hypothetical protein